METPADRFSALQSQGQRDYQEDDYGLLDARSEQNDEEHTVIVVADGMGGHSNGAQASAIATETFIDHYQKVVGDINQRLLQSLEAANQGIAEAISRDPALDNMGTTLVAAVIAGTELHWISVGDSPMWIYRDGNLTQLNADHSMAPLLQDMVAAGKITEEEAATDPGRNSLLAALMGKELELIDRPDTPYGLLPGDLLILASDGLQSLSQAQLSAVLAQQEGGSAASISQALMDAAIALDNPGQDNITVATYRMPERLSEQGEETGEESAATEVLPANHTHKILRSILLAAIVLASAFILWKCSP